jgi:hypothetical protein
MFQIRKGPDTVVRDRQFVPKRYGSGGKIDANEYGISIQPSLLFG